MIFVLLFLIVFYNISKNKTDLEDEAIDYALVTTERNRAQNETKISDLERDVDNTTDVLKKRNLQREIANLKQENAVTDLDEKRIFDNELIEEVRKNLTEGDKEDLKTLKEKSDDIERRMQVLLQDENIDKDVGITNEISALMAKQKNLQDIKNRKFGYANEKKRKIKQSVDELDTELGELSQVEKIYKDDEKKLINSIKYEADAVKKKKMERDLKNLGRAVEKVKEDRELLKRKKKVLNQGRVDNLKTLDLYNEGATAIRAEAVANDSLIRNLEKSRLKRAKTKADREVLERASRRIEEREAQQELVDQALALELKAPKITGAAGETPGDKETVWKSLKEQNYARREYSILKRKRNVLERDVDARRTDVRLATEKYQEELKKKIGQDKLEALNSIGFNFTDGAAVDGALNAVNVVVKAGSYANDAGRQIEVDGAINTFFDTATATATISRNAKEAKEKELAEEFYKENFGLVTGKKRDDAFVAAYGAARIAGGGDTPKDVIDRIDVTALPDATKEDRALKAKIVQFKLDMNTEGLKKEAETTADLVGKREKLKDELKKDYQKGPLKAYGDLVAEGQEYVDTENAIRALEAKLKQTTFIKTSTGGDNRVIAAGGRVTAADLGIPEGKITANQYFHDMTVDNLGKTAETKKAIDSLGEDISTKSGELMSELVGKYKLDGTSGLPDYYARRALGRSLYRNQTTTGLPSKLDTKGVLAARGGVGNAPNPNPVTKKAFLDKVKSIIGAGDGGAQPAALVGGAQPAALVGGAQPAAAAAADPAAGDDADPAALVGGAQPAALVGGAQPDVIAAATAALAGATAADEAANAVTAAANAVTAAATAAANSDQNALATAKVNAALALAAAKTARDTATANAAVANAAAAKTLADAAAAAGTDDAAAALAFDGQAQTSATAAARAAAAAQDSYDAANRDNTAVAAITIDTTDADAAADAAGVVGAGVVDPDADDEVDVADLFPDPDDPNAALLGDADADADANSPIKLKKKKKSPLKLKKKKKPSSPLKKKKKKSKKQ